MCGMCVWVRVLGGCACVRVGVCICMHVCVYVCMCVCVCVCVCVYVCGVCVRGICVCVSETEKYKDTQSKAPTYISSGVGTGGGQGGHWPPQ